MLETNATLPIQHGGNQSAIRARLKLGNRPLLDFSAPLNGLGPPAGAVSAVRRATDSIGRYPEPGAPRLIERLAEYHDIPADHIIVGAGTTELISLLSQVLREPLNQQAREAGEPDRPLAHLVEPTYGEYRRTCAQNNLRTKIWDGHILGWEQEFQPEGAHGIVWTGHPNNPTGRAWERDRLMDLIDRTPEGLTVVDEAYLPFLPDEADRTVIPAVSERENLIVMRSMTKIYAIPGLRIGYAVASPSMVAKFRKYLQPWTVSSAAEVAAIASIDDEEYLHRTIDLIATESARLTDRLWDIPGLRPAWPARSSGDGSAAAELRPHESRGYSLDLAPASRHTRASRLPRPRMLELQRPRSRLGGYRSRYLVRDSRTRTFLRPHSGRKRLAARDTGRGHEQRALIQNHGSDRFSV